MEVVGAWIDQIRDTLYISISRPGKPRVRRKAAKATEEGRKIAERVLARILEQQALDAAMGANGTPPTLADMAQRYLRDDVGHLATTTKSDRSSYLRPDGILLAEFGARRLDAIALPHLRTWWASHIDGKRSVQTGRHYLTVLHQVYLFAIDLGLVATSPVPAMREVIKRKRGTKGARAEKSAQIHAIESAAHVDALVTAARNESKLALVYVLLALDAGLRRGEAVGVTWRCIVYGTDDSDTSRCIRLDERSNRPRGKGKGEIPKGGRTREVALSRRLRAALRELWMAQGRPGGSKLVLAGLEPANFRHRAWPGILARAKVGERDYKDLRDTFASWLLSLGIPGAYVAEQLGHANWSVTAEHYAKWVPKGYVEPPRLAPGEVPADLLTRIESVTSAVASAGSQQAVETT